MRRRRSLTRQKAQRKRAQHGFVSHPAVHLRDSSLGRHHVLLGKGGRGRVGGDTGRQQLLPALDRGAQASLHVRGIHGREGVHTRTHMRAI
jgi:hypothetical protein